MWFFRKKETKDKKWGDLHLSLTNSFSNIKKDVTHLKNKQGENDSQIKEMYKRMDRIEQMIFSTIMQQPTEQVANIEEPNNIQFSTKSIQEQYANLTNMQKSILIQLSILIKESSLDWIAMKFLTQEIYPQKRYESVKSMVSNYTDALMDLGLIEKKRKGRQILLTITEKGYACLPKRVKLIKNKRIN